jgi:hypothetical protein
MNPAIVEKDFWVCWTLKHLFAEPALKGQMVFKGGTSLSKVFGLIDRFSEDIDLILDWRLLRYGHAEGNDPYQTIQSKTKRSRYNQEMNAKAAEYIRSTLLGQLNRLFALVPGIAASIDEADPHTVNVRYPAAFTASYIRPEVRLEIGPLASWVPSHARTIQPYAATSFPKAFAETDCAVVAIDAERTFWEKATILHQEAHRPGTIPARYSRHYYDLCGGPVCSDRFFGFLSGIIARRNRGGGNVKISFIDFQGLWEGRETALSFSALSTDRHFHGRLRCALCRPC